MHICCVLDDGAYGQCQTMIRDYVSTEVSPWGSSTEDSSADADLLYEQFLGGPFPLTRNSSGLYL